MLKILGTSIIGSGFLIFFVVGLLNKLGIIPVVRFKSLFKAFITLTVVFCISFAVKGVVDKSNEIKRDKIAAKTKNDLTGNWKSDDTGYAFSFDDNYANGLLDEIQIVNYEIVSSDEIRLYAGGIDLGTLSYEISKDKQTLVLGESFNYTKTNEDITPLSQKQATYEDDYAEDEYEIRYNYDYDTIDADTAFDYLIGTWRERESGIEVVISVKEDFIATGKKISELDELEDVCVYSSEGIPSYNCYFYQSGYEGFFNVGAGKGNFFFQCSFYNDGTIMRQSVEDRNTELGHVWYIYDKVIE